MPFTQLPLLSLSVVHTLYNGGTTLFFRWDCCERDPVTVQLDGARRMELIVGLMQHPGAPITLDELAKALHAGVRG